jgi:Fe-Mn family superoxide dismutase
MAAYVLPDLVYDYGALEPHIAGKIMELHHDKHHAGYVNGANTTTRTSKERSRPATAWRDDKGGAR